ncbi:hypothetical protein [Tautonia rosea]|uniref:hypothetical protein n=1 Tax=Tautonia rosea TaxID=2728037 RepID=UPI001473938F|nr:hypothetical protein [Tautonia rosea]
MPRDQVEELLYGGESPRNRIAYLQYLREVQRGKSLLQLKAVAAAITPEIRQRWSARSFTPVQTSDGRFDEIVCNISYHFHKHGQKYGTIQKMTDEAFNYLSLHRSEAKLRTSDGLLVLPNGSLYEPGGRIVTFVG